MREGERTEGEMPEKDEYYPVHLDEYIHGRKFIIGTSQGKLAAQIEGEKPEKQ